MPAYQYLINILWWSGGEKKIKITTAQCDLDLEQNTNEKSTTAIRTVFNGPTFLPNPFQRITAYGMTNECCKIYLQKLRLFSPPSTYKLTVFVTSYTWKEDRNRRLNVYVLMSSQPWRMPKACISWLVLAGDLVRSEWWLKQFHSPRKEVFILHVLSLVRFNDWYFLCTDWCNLHVFQSEKMRLLTII